MWSPCQKNTPGASSRTATSSLRAATKTRVVKAQRSARRRYMDSIVSSLPEYTPRPIVQTLLHAADQGFARQWRGLGSYSRGLSGGSARGKSIHALLARKAHQVSHKGVT